MASASHASTVTTAVVTSGSTATSSNATAAVSASGSAATSSAAPATSGTYADGIYTGTAVDNTFGNVQVKVTITNHKIVSVVEVQAPSGGKSQEINSSSAPILEKEAVAAQGSNLDIVSGATYTTKAYASSLQAALDQAKPATTASTS